MAAIDVTVAQVIHTGFAALWTGSVLFVTYAVLPLGMDGEIGPDALATVVGKLKWVTRASALLTFLTGGHLAGNLYTVESLTGQPRGHLVLGMLTLWLLLAALVEIALARMADGLEAEKVRTPARAGRPFLLGASLVAVLLLVDAGMLAASP